MKTKVPLLVGIFLAIAGCAPMHYQREAAMYPDRPDPRPWRVVADRTVSGFEFPESVGCDANEGVLYVGSFGGTELKPLEKDGKGYISKVARDGRLLEARVFDVAMNKPKGIWIVGTRLWVTDIDGVWIFDTRTKKGRKLMIPGAQFANDPAVSGGVLYVTDNRTDSIFRIEPADFLDAAVQPRIAPAWTQRGINPNGIWPARDGTMLIVGFAPGSTRGIHTLGRGGEMSTLLQPVGLLDGVYETRDGGLLVTDWTTGSLNYWSLERGLMPLAKDFKGPADFCVMGDTVYVPDLVKSELRIVRLGK
jgi:hypothetical protein